MATATTPTSSTAPSSPVPGWRTSEGWLSAFTIALGGLPSVLKALGVKYDISPLVQAIGLIVSGLSGIHYTAQRTSLKRASLAATPQAAPSHVPAALATAAATIATIALLACGAGTTAGSQIVAGVGSAGSTFVQCEGVNLEADVGATGLSILATVAKDLLAADFTGALDALISTLGGQVVGCAVLAIEDLEQTLEATGSAAVTNAIAPGVLLQRAKQAQAHYGWQRAPKKTAFRAHAAASSNTIDVGTGDLSSARKQRAHAGSATSK